MSVKPSKDNDGDNGEREALAPLVAAEGVAPDHRRIECTQRIGRKRQRSG